MKRSSFIIPGIVGLLLLIIVIQSIFGGAEVQGSKARSRDGYFALDRLLNKMGMDLKGYRLGFLAVDEPCIFLVHEGPSFTLEQWNHAGPLLDNGGILILSGLPEDKALLKSWNLISSYSTGKPLLLEPYNEALTSLSEPETYQTTGKDEYVSPVILIDNDSSAAFAINKYEKQVYLFTDPDFLRNGRLLENDHAVMVQRFFSTLPDLPFYYYTHPEKRSYMGMQIFTRGALGLLSLQIVLLALLAAWNRAVRVGPPDSFRQDYRRDIHEHLQAVGRLYSQTEKWYMLGKMEQRFFRNEASRYFQNDKGFPDSVNPEELELALQDVHTLGDLKASAGAQKRILDTLKNKKRGDHGNS